MNLSNSKIVDKCCEYFFCPHAILPFSVRNDGFHSMKRATFSFIPKSRNQAGLKPGSVTQFLKACSASYIRLWFYLFIYSRGRSGENGARVQSVTLNTMSNKSKRSYVISTLLKIRTSSLEKKSRVAKCENGPRSVFNPSRK